VHGDGAIEFEIDRFDFGAEDPRQPDEFSAEPWRYAAIRHRSAWFR
jgi:hypothetical protein